MHSGAERTAFRERHPFVSALSPLQPQQTIGTTLAIVRRPGSAALLPVASRAALSYGRQLQPYCPAGDN